MLDYSEHYGTPWGPVIDGGGGAAEVLGVGEGLAGAWARVGGQMPHGRAEQVLTRHTSHPMGDAGSRWSNKVQQGGDKTAAVLQGALCKAGKRLSKRSFDCEKDDA